MKSKEELADELCKYCTRDKKGVYGTDGGYLAGCEGSSCNQAYENYIEEIPPTNREIIIAYSILAYEYGLSEDDIKMVLQEYVKEKGKTLKSTHN